MSSLGTLGTSGKVTKLWMGRHKILRGCLALPLRNSSPGKLLQHQLSRRNSCAAAKGQGSQLMFPVLWYRPTAEQSFYGHEELIVISLWFLQGKGCWWPGDTLCWLCPCHISLTPRMRTEWGLQSLDHLKYHTNSTKNHHLLVFSKVPGRKLFFQGRLFKISSLQELLFTTIVCLYSSLFNWLYSVLKNYIL